MIFKKLPLKFQRFLPLLIALILTGLVIWQAVLIINYSRQAVLASETIKHYIQQVSLEKMDTAKAEQVIDILEEKDTATATIPAKLNNPFKALVKEIEETGTSTATTTIQ